MSIFWNIKDNGNDNAMKTINQSLLNLVMNPLIRKPKAKNTKSPTRS